ncbi:hypothetical protein ACFVU0_18055 [Streptomyces sp. NPDC058122]|uniref:hypothetical protein n=1 Tax=Streptomyces sp. NPDC058122 TaxID=3346349 RepID=UPI0036E6A2EA
MANPPSTPTTGTPIFRALPRFRGSRWSPLDPARYGHGSPLPLRCETATLGNDQGRFIDDASWGRRHFHH